MWQLPLSSYPEQIIVIFLLLFPSLLRNGQAWAPLLSHFPRAFRSIFTGVDKCWMKCASCRCCLYVLGEVHVCVADGLLHHIFACYLEENVTYSSSSYPPFLKIHKPFKQDSLHNFKKLVQLSLIQSSSQQWNVPCCGFQSSWSSTSFSSSSIAEQSRTSVRFHPKRLRRTIFLPSASFWNTIRM